MEPSTLNVIATSAGIAAVISGITNIIGQHFERRARSQTVLLSEALQLARDLRAKAGHGVVIQDDVVNAEWYFQMLQHLVKHGELPNDSRIKRIGSE